MTMFATRSPFSSKMLMPLKPSLLLMRSTDHFPMLGTGSVVPTSGIASVSLIRRRAVCRYNDVHSPLPAPPPAPFVIVGPPRIRLLQWHWLTCGAFTTLQRGQIHPVCGDV